MWTLACVCISRVPLQARAHLEMADRVCCLTAKKGAYEEENVLTWWHEAELEMTRIHNGNLHIDALERTYDCEHACDILKSREASFRVTYMNWLYRRKDRTKHTTAFCVYWSCTGQRDTPWPVCRGSAMQTRARHGGRRKGSYLLKSSWLFFSFY